jgi:hypothetical protein|tara:strand:- start:760 stop:993 length:234 start_codon:yes stop_codon:yes gene_type:complete
MDLNKIMKLILEELSLQVKNEHNFKILKKDILNPIIEDVINELYPYFMKVTVIFITLFILLIIIIFLNIRVIYHKSE